MQPESSSGVRLSVLDLSPVAARSSAAQALSGGSIPGSGVRRAPTTGPRSRCAARRSAPRRREATRDPAIPFGPLKAVPTGVPAPELRVLGASVICGETDAHAEDLASSGDLGWLRFGQGLRDLPPDHGADLQG